ncbi:ABC transporter ATP-binding protein [Sulfurirhabdus autotrophica]|uniref:Teichoic acid transport system ATP-binding protein n=1 Tax=Sulfurirhabdus autotrophica TaxID=1706046 RepID=A0A4R3XUS3_9PROT|nr:ABC transporter ATP-binding protein [Sulfurirhabdus autotrophica]TCV79106.1 teichoic acid transport system ATP-binding protein [Sulfurirhabdus autotrophica]
MCSDIAISAKNLTKRYRIFGHPGDRIKQALTLGRVKFHREFTALNDVSFDIKKGEIVGIIGRNGSGKSTLLQLICGILKPTSGSIIVNGRISALLELGAGFNHEFTGRENVYFQGAIMSIPKEEMDRRFDEIAAFADIGEFIDQPVRMYSSGMFVRLAFATAIYVEPDILIVDEALAVGDMAFQRKCFERLEILLSEKKRIVLFVSHDLRQVERFCSRVIFLRNNQIVADGPAHNTCQLYYEQANQDAMVEFTANKSSRAKITGTGEAELLNIHVIDSNGHDIQEIQPGDPLRIRVQFKLYVPLRQPELFVGTQATDLQYLSAASSAELNAPIHFEPGDHTIEYRLDQFPLVPGQYFVRFAIRDEHFRLLFAGEGLCPFFVSTDSTEFDRPNRLLNLRTEWIVGGLHYQYDKSDIKSRKA